MACRGEGLAQGEDAAWDLMLLQVFLLGQRECRSLGEKQSEGFLCTVPWKPPWLMPEPPCWMASDGFWGALA